MSDICFPNVTLDLGIPTDAIFYLGEVTWPAEPLASRRWAILPSGAVLFSSNKPPADRERLRRRPFNREFGPHPIATLPRDARTRLIAALDELGLFRMKPVIAAPAGLEVQGGVVRYVMARAPDGTRTCVQFKPGGAGSDRLKQALTRILDPHIE